MNDLIQNSTSQDNPPQKRIFRGAFRIGILVALLCAILSHCYSNRATSLRKDKESKLESQSSQQSSEQQNAQLKEELYNRTILYHQQNKQLLDDFVKRLTLLKSEKFSLAFANIPSVVKEFKSTKLCASLCYKMAKDKFYNTTETSEAINQILTPKIIIPCEEGYIKIHEELSNFFLKLQENDNRYRADLAQILNSTGNNTLQDSRKQFISKSLQITSQVEDFAFAKTTAVAGAAIEIIFIKSTVNLLQKCCAKTITGMAGSLGGAAACAVADGPLPIGDIIGGVITIVGVAWTAYDIYQVTEVLPGELQKSLEEMVEGYYRDTLKEAFKQAGRSVQSYEKDSQELIQELSLDQ